MVQRESLDVLLHRWNEACSAIESLSLPEGVVALPQHLARVRRYLFFSILQ